MARPSRRVTWSPEALVDLEGIWQYYLGIAGPDTAEVIVSEIAQTASLLADYPLAGRVRDEVRPKLRSIVAAPYVLFYRVQGTTPQIVRVLDGRQDTDNIFLIS